MNGAVEIIKYEEWCYLQQHNRASMIGSGNPNKVQFGQFSMPLIESVNQILNKNQSHQELCSNALNLLSILLENSDEDKNFITFILKQSENNIYKLSKLNVENKFNKKMEAVLLRFMANMIKVPED